MSVLVNPFMLQTATSGPTSLTIYPTSWSVSIASGMWEVAPAAPVPWSASTNGIIAPFEVGKMRMLFDTTAIPSGAVFTKWEFRWTYSLHTGSASTQPTWVTAYDGADRASIYGPTYTPTDLVATHQPSAWRSTALKIDLGASNNDIDYSLWVDIANPHIAVTYT